MAWHGIALDRIENNIVLITINEIDQFILILFYLLIYLLLLFHFRLFIVYPKAIIRTAIVILNNLYCIPTYTLWMILLLPLKWFNQKLYYKIEGKFFHWLLSVVCMWSWSAGYDGECVRVAAVAAITDNSLPSLHILYDLVLRPQYCLA